ncbi:MAG: hypothetical protein MZV64_02640 [Ignavibacteriales bacterium]|nr:hypothetical protein [Ignavibacteriales bacterium]
MNKKLVFLSAFQRPPDRGLPGRGRPCGPSPGDGDPVRIQDGSEPAVVAEMPDFGRQSVADIDHRSNASGSGQNWAASSILGRGSRKRRTDSGKRALSIPPERSTSRPTDAPPNSPGHADPVTDRGARPSDSLPSGELLPSTAIGKNSAAVRADGVAADNGTSIPVRRSCLRPAYNASISSHAPVFGQGGRHHAANRRTLPWPPHRSDSRRDISTRGTRPETRPGRSGRPRPSRPW